MIVAMSAIIRTISILLKDEVANVILIEGVELELDARLETFP